MVKINLERRANILKHILHSCLRRNNQVTEDSVVLCNEIYLDMVYIRSLLSIYQRYETGVVLIVHMLTVKESYITLVNSVMSYY